MKLSHNVVISLLFASAPGLLMLGCRSDDSSGKAGSSGGNAGSGGGAAGASGGTGGGATGGSGVAGSGAAGSGGALAPFTGSVHDLRMNPPPGRTPITINSAVVIGFSGNNKTMYVQDENGGQYSGISLFCNFTGNCTAWTAATAATTAARGDKIKIVGTFSRFTPTMPAGANEQLQIYPTSIMKVGSGGTPTPVEVPAADLAKGAAAAGNAKWKGVYVKVTMGGPFSVTTLMPPELVNTGYTACMPNGDGGQACCGNGPHFGGFEVSGGGTSILVATNNYRTVALSDAECARMEDRVVTMADRFSSLGGVFDDSFGAQQLAPTVDADYVIAP